MRRRAAHLHKVVTRPCSNAPRTCAHIVAAPSTVAPMMCENANIKCQPASWPVAVDTQHSNEAVRWQCSRCFRSSACGVCKYNKRTSVPGVHRFPKWRIAPSRSSRWLAVRPPWRTFYVLARMPQHEHAYANMDNVCVCVLCLCVCVCVALN